MPLTFEQAKARVSPDAPVQPGSAEHLEIIALMRQSGVVFAEDNVEPPPPGLARTLADFAPYREREMKTPKPVLPSKKDWLSLRSNRKAYHEHIADNATVPVGSHEPPPRHLSWVGKTPPKMDRPMSKHEWISLLK